MKCYNHHDKDSIGMCRNCNKGLCFECAINEGHGIACKNSCESIVKDIDEMILQSKRVYKNSFAIKIGIVTAIASCFLVFFSPFINQTWNDFLIPLGFIALITTIIFKLRKNEK